MAPRSGDRNFDSTMVGMAQVDETDADIVGEDEAVSGAGGAIAAFSPKKRKQAGAVPCCGLCGLQGCCTKKWRGMDLHPPCWNGVRSHNRLLVTPEMKKRDLDLLSREPEKWKAQVLPLVVVGDAARDSMVRLQAKEQLRQETFDERAEEKGATCCSPSGASLASCACGKSMAHTQLRSRLTDALRKAARLRHAGGLNMGIRTSGGAGT